MKTPRFPNTRWSLVGRASAEDEETRQQAVAELLTSYTPGLRNYLVHGRRMEPDMADDLLQDFVADKILAHKLVHHADQGRGKFRNFVLKALSNFATTRMGRENTARSMTRVLDDSITEVLASHPNADRFEQEWVQQVVRDSLQLMEKDCRDRDRGDLWEIFSVRFVEPMMSGVEPMDYAEVVRRLGIQSPRQAMNLLATAKRCFMRNLRVAVGRYVGQDANIDEEIEDLRGIVGR